MLLRIKFGRVKLIFDEDSTLEKVERAYDRFGSFFQLVYSNRYILACNYE